MCTRYFMDDAPSELTEIMEAVKRSPLSDKFIRKFGRPVVTSGEVRPTDIAPVLAPNKNGKRSVYPMRWGFTNPNHNSTIFNARAESAGQKPTFRDAWKSHRCIVPASYYFEWEHFKSPDGSRTKTGGKYIIQPQNAAVTWLCGLYRIEDGFPVFVILTREPGASVAAIHDRMPLILPQEKIDEWIDPSADPNQVSEFALTEMVAEKASEDSKSKTMPAQLSFFCNNSVKPESLRMGRGFA